MNRQFWQFIHDRLERAWHWVYFEKLRTTEDHLKHMRAKNFMIERVRVGQEETE